MRWFWQEKPRPLFAKESLTPIEKDYEIKRCIHGVWLADVCYECVKIQVTADMLKKKLDDIAAGQDKLLQSHAALEQKLQSIEERLPTKLFAEIASVADALSRLDARLKGTGDAIAVLLEERFATLDQQIAYILHDLLADLRKAKEPARRKKAKK